MKRFLFAAAIAAATAPVFAADVGVSVTVGEPGFYGHIDIGDFPQPQLIYPTAVVIQQAPAGVVMQPLYLHVPPGHARHWGKHCHEYNACGQPVYFVQDRWYNNVYVPRYRERHGDDREHGHDGGDRDEHHDHGRGHGKGRGGD